RLFGLGHLAVLLDFRGGRGDSLGEFHPAPYSGGFVGEPWQRRKYGDRKEMNLLPSAPVRPFREEPPEAPRSVPVGRLRSRFRPVQPGVLGIGLYRISGVDRVDGFGRSGVMAGTAGAAIGGGPAAQPGSVFSPVSAVPRAVR